MHSGLANALCMSPTLCDSVYECASICVWRWKHTECAGLPLVCSNLNTNSLSIIFKSLSLELRQRVVHVAPQWNVCTCSEPLKHMNSIPPCSLGDWVEFEHGRNLILQAVPLCLKTVRDLLNGSHPLRKETRRGEERRESSKEKHLEGLPNGTCLYIAQVHYILHSTRINSLTH